MKRLTLFLYLLLTIVLAAATLIEYSQGTAFVTTHIYHSSGFIILWCALGVLLTLTLFKKRMWRVWPSFLMHLSFVVILSGALTTYLTSRKGFMHLRIGESSFQYVEEETRQIHELPFTLLLDTFYINYYSGTNAPADYVSVVLVDKEEIDKLTRPSNTDSSPTRQLYSSVERIISMNNVLDHKGYRFYQSSYDKDSRGTWLSVNYDPWGTGITYAGYTLLFVAMLGLLLHPGGTFRKLLRRSSLTIIILLIGVTASTAQETKTLSIISRAEADSMTSQQVIYHDRVVPFNTLARDFVKKLYGKETFSGLTAEQIIGSWQRYPEEWAYVPAIKIKDNELCRRLGLKGNYARIVDLFLPSDGPRSTNHTFSPSSYKLRIINDSLRVPLTTGKTKPSPLQKAILETDEKVALVMMLQNGDLVRPLPSDSSVPPLSKTKLQAELLYNRIPFTKILFMFNLTMGIVLFMTNLLTRYKLTKNKLGDKIQVSKLTRNSIVWSSSTAILFFLSFLIALFGYLLRWYIAGRIPLSNGYETMQFLALCIMAVALVARHKLPAITPFGFLLSGFTLLVAYLGEMNPHITPLMPVLVSPWLSLHVSVIMMSYALFAFTLMNGVWALCVPREAEHLMHYSLVMLYPAVFLLTAGIFIGAVWANVSWGRYWGWDPKEVWALITMLVYALPLHSSSLPWFRKPRFFHLYIIVAFLCVLITYFGVNFFLGGMHSYA